MSIGSPCQRSAGRLAAGWILFALGGAGVERDGVRVAVILRVAVVAAGLAGHIRGLDRVLRETKNILETP